MTGSVRPAPRATEGPESGSSQAFRRTTPLTGVLFGNRPPATTHFSKHVRVVARWRVCAASRGPCPARIPGSAGAHALGYPPEMQGLRKLLALPAALAILTLAGASAAPARGAGVPPEFTRDASGAAVDGQIVRQEPRAKRQIVAIIPDRTTGRDWGLRYLREAVDDFNRTAPDAVFCVGDLVQGYSRDHDHVLGERRTFLDIVGRLRMPFYPTAGNHDVVSGARDAGDRSFADEYRALFGPLYYAVELELASFVILNTEDGDGRIQPGFSDEQLAWLDVTLARLAQRGKPIVLLFHRPLWDHKPTRWDERVQPLLVKHRVAYVIAGHYHALSALPPRDGIPYLLLGTCGGANDQHPLAGHLHHVTFLVIGEDGSIEPYHQIAGTTLPVDWVVKADQDAAYGLKTARNAVVVRGAVQDPLGRKVDGSIEIVLRNPIDRDVEFSLHETAPPAPLAVVDRDALGEIERVWTSRTPIDLFNPATTDLASPFTLDLPKDAMRLAPGETRTIVIPVRCDAQVAPPMPAPFDVVARFTDSKSRTVPIVLRQRLPIARSVEVGTSLEAATDFGAEIWNWSEYDTAERRSLIRFAQKPGAAPDAESGLEIRIDTHDESLSPDAKPGAARARLDDLLGDGVRITLGEREEAREYLVSFDRESGGPTVESLDASGQRLEAARAARATLLRTDRGWRLSIALEPSARPVGASSWDGLPINVGIADNDETYHTQWRWLAPRQVPAKLQWRTR